MGFSDRVSRLPWLGLGVSTEYGAGHAPGALDLMALRDLHPDWAGFLEVGVEASRGLDEQATAWVARGLPTTYHYLDVNLDEPEDFEDEWLASVRAHAGVLRPAWMCGDAGMWHLGRRERGHMLLLPPVLCAEAADALAEGVVRLRDAVGYEVLPENPPGRVFLGDLHLLHFFARVAERADTGLVLDCAHLGMFQRLRGLPTLAAFEGFPLERVVEIHVAGGSERHTNGFTWVDDDHGPAVLADTWRIVEHVIAGAPHLKAVVFECERNPLAAVRPVLARLAGLLAERGAREGCTRPAPVERA